jgi:hypothetical protein
MILKKYYTHYLKNINKIFFKIFMIQKIIFIFHKYVKFMMSVVMDYI